MVVEEKKSEALTAFEKRYGYIPERDNQSDKFRIGAAQNDSPILYAKRADTYIRMNSLYNPEHEADRWAGGIKIDNKSTLIIMDGFSDGYFLKALMENVRPDAKVIVFEPDQNLLYFVLQNFPVTDIVENDRIYLMISPVPDQTIIDVISDSVMQGMGQVLAMTTPCCDNKNDFEKLKQNLAFFIGSDQAIRLENGKDNFKNLLYAINSIHRNYQLKDFYDRFDKDIPVIIVAGGPSLKKNIDELKSIKKRALIVATDRAVSILLDHGIMPDIMVTIDGQKDPDFISDDRVRNIPLLANYTCNRTAQAGHQESMIYFYPMGIMGSVPGMSEKNIYFPNEGGSVATAAYYIFTYIGARHIILIGQDLAYTAGEEYIGVLHDGKKKEDLLEVEGVDGETVYAPHQLNGYRLFFENTAKEYPEVELIDATEGGALIHGSKVMTLRGAIDKYCHKKYDFSSLLDLGRYSKGQTLEEHMETIQYMNDRIGELFQIKKYSSELKNYCNRLKNIATYGSINDGKNRYLIDKTDELRIAVGEMPANYILESEWIEDTSLIPEATFYIRNNDEAKQVYERAYEYYKRLPDECDSLIAAIKAEFVLE